MVGVYRFRVRVLGEKVGDVHTAIEGLEKGIRGEG